MDAINSPGIHTVVVMSSAQVGKTEILLNILGYHIHHDPAPILMLQPTLDMAEAFSKDRLAPMVRDTPALKGKIADPRSRDSGNTLLHKRFPGGHVTMAGANSPASLASRPIRVVLCDEVDRYPASAGTEGDPVSLATKRSATFWNRKRVLTSTPTVKGLSRIEAAFEASDKRRYHVPCPHCGHRQALSWAYVQWPKDRPGQARYHCAQCRETWTDAQRAAALVAGAWIAEAPEVRGTAGFHLSELYSPWRRIGEIASDFMAAKAGGPELLKTWVNTSLGETWEDEGETVDPSGLIARRERWPAEVPAPAVVLVAGVDVQDDRLEVFIWGAGHGDEVWLIDWRTLPGDPSQAEVWADLDDALSATYGHASGARLGIAAACIDSGGHHTQMVYDFAKSRLSRRIYAVKGIGGPGRPLVSAPARRRTGADRRRVDLYSVGTDDTKGLIYSRLRMTTDGPGYIHLGPAANEEFVAQLTAEKMATRYRKGWPVREWIKTRPRNEALDGLVYALAALRLLNPRYHDLAAALNSAAPRSERTPGGLAALARSLNG